MTIDAPHNRTALDPVPQFIAQQVPADSAARKAIPVYTGCFKYFPKALQAIAALSLAATAQHHPGQPLHWDRSKSTDELDAAARHLLDAGTLDIDGQRHSAKLAWRALANLEKEIENETG